MALSNPFSSSAGISGISSGVGDLFGAIGDFQEADAYGKAASIAQQNERIVQESTNIQESQAQRAITKTLGAGRADVAGNGLKMQGTALNIMQASGTQGALTKQLIQTQGAITKGGFAQEAAAYQGMQAASNAAGASGVANGIGNILGAFIPGL